MSRIPTLTLETMSEEQQRIYRGIIDRCGSRMIKINSHALRITK